MRVVSALPTGNAVGRVWSANRRVFANFRTRPARRQSTLTLRFVRRIDKEISSLYAQGFDIYPEESCANAFREALLDHGFGRRDVFCMVRFTGWEAELRCIADGKNGHRCYEITIVLNRTMLEMDDGNLRGEIRLRIREGVRMGADTIARNIIDEEDAWTRRRHTSPRTASDLLSRLALT
jgi:hypothetical protein